MICNVATVVQGTPPPHQSNGGKLKEEKLEE